VAKIHKKPMLTSKTFDFLKDLSKNNNREWFSENRKRYDTARIDLENLVSETLKEILFFENWVNTNTKDCIFRINRDVRFSKDKSPYKNFFSAAFGDGGRHSGKIDYYLHLQPNNESFIGAGIYNVTTEQLGKFRQEIDYNAVQIKTMIENEYFKAYYPEIWGEKLKKAPKGYAADHPDLELLCRKQLFFMHRFKDEDIFKPNFPQEIAKACKIVKPFTDFVNELFYGKND
jgi:uncharacterized protein (TIGR02453 family)